MTFKTFLKAGKENLRNRMEPNIEWSPIHQYGL